MDELFKALVDVLGGMKDVIFILGLVIPLVLLILSVVMTFLGSYGMAYRSSASKVIKYLESTDDPKDVGEHTKYLPPEARTAWREYVKTRRGKPSDYMQVSACVENPLKRSWIPVFTTIANISAPVFAFLSFAFTLMSMLNFSDNPLEIGNITGVQLVPAALILLVGWLVSVVLTLMNKLGYSLTMRSHQTLTDMLDTKLQSAVPAQEAPAQNQAPQAPPQAKQAAQAKKAAPPPPQQAPVQAAPQPQAQAAPPPQQFQQPQFQAQAAPPPQQFQQPQFQAQAAPPPQQFQQPQFQAQAAPPPQQFQQPQFQAQAAPPPQQFQQPQFQAQAAPPPPQFQQPQMSSSAVDMLVGKIKLITSGQGNPAELRDLATKLQAEKAKPENKSPEMQKKITDGLTMILNLMKAKSGQQA